MQPMQPPPQQQQAYQPPPQNQQFQPQYDPNGQYPQQQQGGGGYRGNHPIAAFFHVFFKFVAALVYLVGKVFGLSFIGVFIGVVLLLAADFWVVKNVTGRLLVRLRWWNRIREDGESEWVFESHPQAQDASGFDSNFFWMVTYASVIVWLAFFVFTLMSPTNIPLTLLGVLLNAANAVGYYKCRNDAQKRMTQFALNNPGLVMRAARAV